MTRPTPDDRPDRDEADVLMRELAPYMRRRPGDPPVPPDLAERVERFARASGVDPDTVMPLHIHTNPATGQSARSSSWPCPQCVALGRTEPLQYGQDLPDTGGTTMTEIPPDRLEAYLATFPAPPQPGGHRARRKARRKAEHQERRKNR